MKGGQPFIFNPQGWLCRPEERLISRFLADFLSVCRRPYKKIRTTCKTVASVLHVTGCQKYFFDTLRTRSAAGPSVFLLILLFLFLPAQRAKQIGKSARAAYTNDPNSHFSSLLHQALDKAAGKGILCSPPAGV